MSVFERFCVRKLITLYSIVRYKLHYKNEYCNKRVKKNNTYSGKVIYDKSTSVSIRTPVLEIVV